MLKSNTHTIAQVLSITSPQNTAFQNIGFDTRKPMNGALFLALVGEHFDGHDYVEQAQKMGAVALIVSKPIKSSLPVLMVDDTQVALTKIARWHLHNIKPITIAITGSNGKTTCKNMLANILNFKAPTLKTFGNLNNHLGVPMTLLQLTTQHQYAVIEMGASHLGEIKHLRNIINPDVAVVINTNDAHLGEFGGFENLVKAKGEIYSSNSHNVVNTQTLFKGDSNFGESGDVFATNIKNHQFVLHIQDKKIDINLQLLGKHNVENALAASACALALGIDINTIKQGLEKTKAEKGRLFIIKKAALTLIDDSYNANPSSVKQALTVLANFSGERVAILGKMGELGDKSAELHAEIGKYAKKLNIDFIYSVGSHAKNYGVQHFDNEAQLLTKLKSHKTATLLFKGSRVAKLEKVIKKICV